MNIQLHQQAGHGEFGRKLHIDGGIFIPGSATPIACAIRDITSAGALISIPAVCEIPDRFDLGIPANGSVTPVRVVGRSQEGLTVFFTGTSRPLESVGHGQDGVGHGQGGGIITEEPRMAKSVHSAALENIANFDRFKITPGFSFFFVADPVYSTRGHCKVAVTIRNLGKIVAHQPFLCLPVLGLILEAANGWAVQEVTAVRKMRRFFKPGVYDLAPGDSIHCCSIVLPFSASEGGTLEYEHGRQHALPNLPDLRLTCIAGAGNYPSDRVPFIVPAIEIRRFFQQTQKRGEIPQLDGVDTADHGVTVV